MTRLESPAIASDPPSPSLVLGRLARGTFWLGLQIPLQILLAIWSLRLIVESIGPAGAGAYRFACGIGLFQSFLEVGLGSTLQRRISLAWARGDRAGVDRAITCGLFLVALVTLAQLATAEIVVRLVLPHSGFSLSDQGLIIRVLWLQTATSPLFSVAILMTIVLNAAHRYDLAPQYELAITAARFLILVAGVKLGADFFRVIATQTATILGIRIVPSLRVLVGELGYQFRFRGEWWGELGSLRDLGLDATMYQFSMLLADKADTTILGLILPDPGQQVAIYDVISKPFLLLRQSGWTLASLVMPAVASRTVADDKRVLAAITYDGARLHLALLLPLAVLAWIFAGPFLSLWFGQNLGYDAAREAPLMRLFLLAALPLILAIPVQIAIGMNKMRPMATYALIGSLINVPLSCYLTSRLGISGVIWGTVLTTLPANLMASGVHLGRILEIDYRLYLCQVIRPSLLGIMALIIVSSACGNLIPPHRQCPLAWFDTSFPLSITSVSLFSYLFVYVLNPSGRRDLHFLVAKLRRG